MDNPSSISKFKILVATLLLSSLISPSLSDIIFQERFEGKHMLLIGNPTLRRLAQNREATRKSRLRKKVNYDLTAASTFSDLKVLNIIPLKGGAPPKFSQRTQLSTENYRVL
ncbi:hypothetical protein POM88_046441 [Heracleum sosnowskyi]|uniref:Uncharacterized protein n=1 Tax=Heracleum sosnowskyi TaxID=360622 RepID=A0AAD8M759_9APIA|nr:hypothetical protein POM88_046441 [Heracleum sosnowskyi]